MPVDTPSSWLRPLLRPLLPVFGRVAVLSFCINLLALAAPIFVMQVYDRVVFHHGVNTLTGLVAGMLLVVGFDFSLRQTRARILQRVALQIDVAVGRRLFGKLVALPLAVLERQSAAHWHALFRDIDTVRNTMSGSTAVMICDLPFVVLFLLLIFVIAEPVAWVIVVLLPLFLAVAAASGRMMTGLDAGQRTVLQGRDAMIAEIIAGRTTVKALGLDRALQPLWEQHHAAAIDCSMRRGSRADTCLSLATALTVLATVAMTGVGALAVMEQRLSIGALIAANMLSGRLVGPLNQLVGQWRSFSAFGQAVRRLGAIFALPDERATSPLPMPRPGGSLRLETVSFSYEGAARPAIAALSLHLPAPGLHGLIGRNGSGKSTLLKLLQGLYPPDQGRVLLDGADISQFSRHELAGWIGYVPQETALFAGTLRDNIACRCPEAADAEILAAAQQAGVHGFAVDLPDGYATQIGEAGRRLSAGQRQRIALARALVGQPPVLLLDEPSSHIDRQGEADLRRTLCDLARDRTIVIVTHSPLLLSGCATLTVLDGGGLARHGATAEVLPQLLHGGRVAGTVPARGTAA